MNEYRKFILETAERARLKVVRRGLLSLAWHTMAFMAATLLLGSAPVLSGAGNVWVHTQPEPTAFRVNAAIAYSMALLLWAWMLRVQVTTSLEDLPQEALWKRRIRLALLWMIQLQVATLVIEAVLLIIRNAVWWFSWH